MSDQKPPIDASIDPRAIDSLSVAPPDPDKDVLRPPAQDAGRDASIAERLERDPANAEAKLDAGIDESMDASDPPALVQPGGQSEPAPSSGFDEEAERALRERTR